MIVRKELSGCAAAVLVAYVAGCISSSSSASPASSTSPATRVFIGTVSGSDARVGVVATDHSARIFFCDGSATYTSMTHWIPAVPIDSDGGALAPQGASGGWTIAGQLDDAGVSGTVTPVNGPMRSFHADPVAAGTIAGLYEAAGPCGKVGLIVAQGSATEVPVGQGACVPASGGASPEQVNPIHPIERAPDGTISVVVDGAQILLHAAAPPAD